jgi:uncharacterized membrane protein YsdA (DUF1294 family)
LERWPTTVLWIYLIASAISFATYAIDKSAARAKRWRISERNLHLLALFGGWPGAWVAQNQLRHKTQKSSFQGVFWLTVAINCGGLFWFFR